MLDDEGKVSRELASVIGADKLDDVQGSNKLREFYKKLIQTDAQIKKLRQNFESNNIINPELGYNINVPERYKRSLKFIKPKNRGKYDTRNKHNKRFNMIEGVSNNGINKRKRIKRYEDSDQPDGYLIEKKKVLIQYKPIGSKRHFSKCIHAPKDSKSHENQLKHPFYQKSQRLDELLDNILDRHFPEIIKDPLTLDLLFSHKAKCNHKSESKSNNLDSHNYPPNDFQGFSGSNELKSSQDTSIYKTTNQNFPDYFKEEITSFSTPIISTYVQNITLFDKNVENRNYEKLQNLEKTGSNRDKSKYFTDPSLSFMAKIHGVNNLQTSSISNFENINVNNIKASDTIHPVMNYETYKSIYDQNLNHKILPNKVDNEKMVMEDKNVNLNVKGLPQDNLMDLVIDDTRTDKTFDMNLDYSDILLSSTPKINERYVTNSITQERERNVNLQHYITDWRRKSNSLRKLLQIEEEDDDTFGYEDLKEVLADEMEAHDETDRRVDRTKRNKYFPDVYNRNWKGPIPLYPDEINAMVKQAAIENTKIPVNTKDITELDRQSNEISDTDYIEDYFDNKYDRLVKIAQAYSDYGVFGSKKEGLNLNKEKPVAEKDVSRNRLDVSGNFNSGLNVRSKKEFLSPSEGIRFEIKPGKGESIVKEADIKGVIQKHFKYIKGNKSPEPKTPAVPFVHPDFSPIPNLSTSQYSFDKPHKYDSKSMEESISAPKRALKSIEYPNVDDTETDTARDVYNTSMNKDGQSFKDVSDKNRTPESFKDETKIYSNNSNVNTTVQASDFFAMMSDWFSVLSKLSGETNMSGINNSSTISRDNIKDNKSLEVSYPSYDSDMIENIGHRSRVLMSVEDTNASQSVIDLKTKEEDKDYNKNKQFPSTLQTIGDTVSSILVTPHVTENVTVKDTNDQTLKDGTNIENKTISKRSVETDSKLNFWDDIYDDEYGVKLDNFDKSTRDKHFVKSGDLVKKSKHWVEGKVKGIANKLRSSKSTKKGAITENILTESTATKVTSTSKPKTKKRRIRNLFKADSEDPNDFGALTANMKKVVREAAEAVRETRKLKVREDNKEDTMASSLMQQLVRLMSDVVDFQVQQKTCAKLPSDLQKFLEWLMSASDKEEPPLDLPSQAGLAESNSYNGYGNDLSFQKKSSDDNAALVMPEDHLDDRTQCLGSIQSVLELMKQYDDMNDEDKSKMTGVKQYLENQLNFLNKKVSALDEFNIYKYYRKREASNHNLKSKRKEKIKRRFKRRINKFIKNYSKKHTKTTAGNIDVVSAKNMKKN